MANYYVSTTGNNSNPGTEAQPWLTLQKAADTMIAGDTCFVRAGSYGGFTGVNDGNASNFITFKNYPNEIVYLDATLGKVTGTNVIDDVINVSFKNYIVIDGFRITGNTEDSGTHTNRAHVSVEMGSSSFIILRNCWVSYGWGTGVGIYNEAHDIIVEDCRIFENAKDNYPRQTVRDWGAGMIAFHGCYNILFKNNLIYWNHGEGVTAGDHSHEVTFDGNVVCDNWQTNLYAADGSQNITVINNLVYNTQTAKDYPFPSVGYHANDPAGIQMTAGDSASSYSFDQRHLTGFRIYNNIVIHCAASLLRYLAEAGHTDSDWIIANNTLIADAGGMRFNGSGSLTNVKIQNNIITGNLGGGSNNEFINIAPIPSSSIISNNIYNSPILKWVYNGTLYTSYSSWASASGDSDSFVSDPQLQTTSYTLPVLRTGLDTIDISAIAGQVRPIAISPGINAGADLSTYFTTDRAGIIRPQGSQWDIGAFEFLNTYYVSKTGSNGDGLSLATAKTTIVAGLNLMSPGNTLFIAAGTYDEELNETFKTTGSSVNPFIISTYQNDIVRIKPTTGDYVIQSDVNQSYYTWKSGTIGSKNLIFDLSASPGKVQICKIFSDGWVLQDVEALGGGIGTVSGGALISTNKALGQGRNCIFRRVKLHDGGITEFDNGFYLQNINVIIDDCEIYKVAGAGIQFYGAGTSVAGGRAINNYIHNCGLGGSNRAQGIILYNGFSDLLAYNNVIAFLSGNGSGSGGILIGGGTANAGIYNNSIYNLNSGVYGILNDSGAGNANVIKNNIAYLTNGIQDDKGDAIVSDNLLTNPSFTDPNNGLFTLQIGSSGIDTGVDLSSVFTTDKLGTTRPTGAAWDKGAYEYTSPLSGQILLPLQDNMNQRIVVSRIF